MSKKNGISQRWRGVLFLFTCLLSRILRPFEPGMLLWAFCTPFMRVKPRAEETALLAGAEYFHMKLAGRVIGGWRIGNEEKRVLFMHGWAGNAAQLAPWVAGLRAEGFSIVAMDAPAHGSSPGLRACMDMTTDSLLALGEQVGPFAGIVSHSFGGLTVSRAMQRGLRVGRFVAIVPPTGPHYFFQKMLKILRIPKKRWAKIDEKVALRIGAPMPEFDMKVVWKDIKVPVFVVHDRSDREVHFSCHQRWLEAAPHAEALITEDLGHRRIIRDPKVIEAGIAFLARETAEAGAEERAPAVPEAQPASPASA